MPYIIKAGAFAVGTTFSSRERAEAACERMGIQVGHEVIYVPAYLTVGDNEETIKQHGTNLAKATDDFIDFCLNGDSHTYAMTLQDDNGNVLLYWTGGMGGPEFSFLDPMEPDKGDRMREQERHEDHYWNYERPNEGAPEL